MGKRFIPNQSRKIDQVYTNYDAGYFIKIVLSISLTDILNYFLNHLFFIFSNFSNTVIKKKWRYTVLIGYWCLESLSVYFNILNVLFLFIFCLFSNLVTLKNTAILFDRLYSWCLASLSFKLYHNYIKPIEVDGQLSLDICTETLTFEIGTMVRIYAS